MPRRYRMSARGAAVEETRRRIVEASKALQAEHGLAGTSYEEIAERAGVAPATVYRHFPTLDELIPACARTIPVFRPLTPDVAGGIFRGLRRPSQRIEWLIRGTCACYAADGGWLNAARREAELIPELWRLVQVQRESVRALVSAALEGREVDEQLVNIIAALADFPFWRSLLDAGLSEAEATEQVIDLARYELGKANVQ